ncbi:MAG: ABC transporter permease [Turicibacter sp.]|nr:ABC transporter permease [Turicibacter sp.]
MLFNILKKDLKRKKVMNLIIFMFITLCTVFLASSVSNLMATTTALDYFSEQSNLSDYFIVVGDPESELTDWLEDEENENVIEFVIEELINLDAERILIGDTGNEMEGMIMLASLPVEMIVPLDFYNVPFEELENGEIAITFREARQHDIEIGDTLYIEIDDVTHEFEVAHFVKDIMFFPRLFITQYDFDQIIEETEVSLVYTYMINVDDIDEFTTELNREMISGLGTRVRAEMFTTGFMIELMMMIILVLIGMCLIVISFVVLRFAIVFTLQEDFKEIGIMKAIGLKDKEVKKVYMIKYFFLALLGAMLGFFISFPFGEWLISDVQENIAFPDTDAMFWARVISTVVIVSLILLFSYMSTRKLKKFTAMQAIRSGETGERFDQKTLIHLHRRKRMPAILFLALNDVFSQMKSYLVLLVVFTLGYLLAVIPLNASNTLSSEKLASLAGVPIADVTFDQLDFETTPFEGRIEDLRDELASMERFYRHRGVEMTLQAQVTFAGMLYTDEVYEGFIVNNISQTIRYSREVDGDVAMYRGYAPEAEDEIAITTRMASQLALYIDDEINLHIDGESKRLTITGIYESDFDFGIYLYNRLVPDVSEDEDERVDVFVSGNEFAYRVAIEEIIQPSRDPESSHLEILRGDMPILYNEVALTEFALDELGLDIGDEVNIAIHGESYTFLITGSYQSLTDFGLSVFLSEAVVLDEFTAFSVFTVQGDFIDQGDIEGQIARIEELGGDDSITISLDDFVDRILLDVSIIDTVGQLILLVVLLVNILIIALMGISFMMRDIRQIALIKSLGFRSLAIKKWQGLRILLIMIISLILGILLVPSANMIARIPFGVMGAPDIELVVDEVQVYMLYPIIFIIVTILTLTVTTLSIKKVGLTDLGATD